MTDIRIVVAGCREYCNYEEAKKFIDFCICEIRYRYNLIFISGNCKGADKLGERYAEENGFLQEYYSAKWDKYGKSAGPIRNREMAKACDIAICFWDGKSAGTKSFIKYVKQLGKPIKIKIITINNK